MTAGSIKPSFVSVLAASNFSIVFRHAFFNMFRIWALLLWAPHWDPFLYRFRESILSWFFIDLRMDFGITFDGFSLNVKLRVSFSPGRDRVCRHWWNYCFWTPWENGRCFSKKGPLDNTSKICFEKNYLDITWKYFENLDLGDDRVKFVVVVFKWPL